MANRKRQNLLARHKAMADILTRSFPAQRINQKDLDRIVEAIDGATRKATLPRTVREKDALLRHRERLRDNPNWNSPFDKDKLQTALIPHLRNAGVQSAGHESRKEDRIEFIDCILDAQDGKPYFHVESGGLPYCWNASKHFEHNQIVYQWGHMIPQNSTEPVPRPLENLCLQSERCNLHVQSGMSVAEVAKWLSGSEVERRIRKMDGSFAQMFKTGRWQELVSRLMSPVGKSA